MGIENNPHYKPLIKPTPLPDFTNRTVYTQELTQEEVIVPKLDKKRKKASRSDHGQTTL